MDGYSTIFFEITAQLAAQGHWTPPDLVLVPVGVGGLARAAVRHFKQPFYPVSLPGLPHTHVAPRPCQRAQPCPSQRILDEEQHLYSSSSHPTAVSHATRRPYPTFIVSVEPVSAASLMRAIALDDDGRGLVVAETLLPEGSGGGQEGDYVSVPRHRLAPLLERLDMLDRYGKSDNDSGAAEQQPMQWWPPHRHQQEQQPTSPLSPLLSPRSEPQTSPLALALQSSQQSSSVLQSLRPPLQQPRQQNKHKPAVTDGFGYKLVSEWAWDPWLRRGIDAALAVTDAEVDAAVRMLRDDLGISVGPCGAAALAGLVSRVAPLITASEAEICYATGGMRRRSAAEVRAALGLDEDAVIVLISTATYGATNAQDESGWDM